MALSEQEKAEVVREVLMRLADVIARLPSIEGGGVDAWAFHKDLRQAAHEAWFDLSCATSHSVTVTSEQS